MALDAGDPLACVDAVAVPARATLSAVANGRAERASWWVTRWGAERAGFRAAGCEVFAVAAATGPAHASAQARASVIARRRRTPSNMLSSCCPGARFCER
jgi:hypothetical protein